jgi:CBS domain containing-hemolysin-like protein
MALELVLTIFLVFLNGFFVAAEFAIVKVRLSQIELRAKSSKAVADLSRNIVRNLDAYLSATQLGITLASLGLGWVGEALFADIILNIIHSFDVHWTPEFVHGLALTIAFAAITIMHIVFGELAPKSLAIQKPLNTTFVIAYPLQFFYVVFRPFIWALNGLASSIVRMLGINPALGHESHTSEELQIILNQSKESGTLDQSEHELIQNVFEFNDRIIKKIMVPRTKICAIEVTQPLEEIMEVVTQEGFTRIPVYRESIDEIIGFLHVKDVFSTLYKKEEFKMHQLLRPVLFVPESMRLNELLKQMQGKSTPMMAIVLDEFGGTAGLATIEDVIEELV